MSFRIRIADRAARQILEAESWWATNRPAASHAFADDLEDAFRIIRSAPEAGQVYRHPRYLHQANLRRILLMKVHYFVYYKVSAADSVIEIAGLWHTSRQVPPRL